MTSDSVGWGKVGAAGPRILVAELDLGPRAFAPSIALGVISIGMPSYGRVTVETAASLSQCIDCARRVDYDLVVVDESLGAEAEEIVARLRSGAASLVVLQRTPSDAAALAWFRRGAAEVVLADRDLAALRHAAREQIERVRAARAGGASRDGVSAADGILRHLGSAVVLVDAAGEITFANPAAEQILGSSMIDLHGKPLRAFLAEQVGEIQLASALAGVEATPGIETRVRRGDGSFVPIALSCGPVFGTDGRPGGVVAAFRDLSDAQEWRAHVLQTEKMASIGQLAAGVAHEINNPMGFIHANLFQMTEYVADLRQIWNRAEVLLKAIDAEDPDTVRAAGADLSEVAAELDVGFVLQDLAKAIRESQEGSERIRHIVQDLRDFSHQDTGERVLADLNQCLDSTANIVWPMMKHIVVLSKNYGDLPPVPCYPMQIKQVFMNLLVNAYQAIEEAVAKRAHPGAIGTVTLTTSAHDGGVLVEIADTGTGIAPDHVDRIFDPFFTTKKVGAGTGLGLSTSFNIIRKHGGTMRVESALGRGTAFRIHLPLLGEEIGSEPR
ncbi:MAG TPA: ATP-binding protein [Myxococcota bacterium]|nr:ATP-binding protein [Myxococcota bacterium]